MGTASYFHGIQSLRVSPFTLSRSAGLTLFFWGQITVAGGELMSIADSGGTRDYLLANTGGVLRLDNYVSGVDIATPGIGNWFAIALVWSGTNISWYVSTDGSTWVATGTRASATITEAVFTVASGTEGYMQYMRMWTAALTSSELITELHSTTPVRSSNLWAYWMQSFDWVGYPDELFPDESGNGHDLKAQYAATYPTDAGVAAPIVPPTSGSENPVLMSICF
jgi:hypothetical protein